MSTKTSSARTVRILFWQAEALPQFWKSTQIDLVVLWLDFNPRREFGAGDDIQSNGILLTGYYML
jgi:hypothetical protein